MRKGRKILPYIAEMPKPYVFDIERINKELKENSKVIEGIKDYIANKCDVTADTEHSLSGTPSKAVQLAGELGEHPANYSSFEDGTYNWFPVSVFDKKNKEEFDTFKNLEKEPEFDERRYTKILSWAKGTYIEEVLKELSNVIPISFKQKKQTISLSNKIKKFEMIKIVDNLNWPQLERIESNMYKFPGVHLISNYRRHYPYANYFSHIIGSIRLFGDHTLILVKPFFPINTVPLVDAVQRVEVRK